MDPRTDTARRTDIPIPLARGDIRRCTERCGRFFLDRKSGCHCCSSSRRGTERSGRSSAHVIRATPYRRAVRRCRANRNCVRRNRASRICYPTMAARTTAARTTVARMTVARTMAARTMAARMMAARMMAARRNGMIRATIHVTTHASPIDDEIPQKRTFQTASRGRSLPRFAAINPCFCSSPLL